FDLMRAGLEVEIQDRAPLVEGEHFRPQLRRVARRDIVVLVLGGSDGLFGGSCHTAPEAECGGVRAHRIMSSDRNDKGATRPATNAGNADILASVAVESDHRSPTTDLVDVVERRSPT